MKKCKECKWWEVYKDLVGESAGTLGTCRSLKTIDHITVGYADEFSFDSEFCCINWEETE